MLLQLLIVLFLIAIPYALFYRKNWDNPKSLRHQTWYEWLASFKIAANFTDLEKLLKRNGPVFYHSLMGMTIVQIVGKEATDFIIQQERLGYVKNSWPEATSKLLGPNSLAVLDGTHHARIRKLLSIIFKPNQPQIFIPKIKKIVDNFILNNKGKQVEMQKAMITLTSQIAIHCLFGVDEYDSPEWQAFGRDFNDWKNGLFALPINLPGFAFQTALTARSKLLSFIKEQVLRAKQKYEDSGRNEALKTPLVEFAEAQDEHGETLSMEAIADGILTVYFAGHDTSSSTLTSLFESITAYKTILQQVKAECEKLKDLELNNAKLNEMNYLEACIKEQLRLRSPAGAVFKTATEDLVYEDKVIEKGSTLFINLSASMMLAGVDYAPTATFEPRRWIESSEGKTKYGFSSAYVPWGIGKHSCLGRQFAMMEMKIILSEIFQNVDITRPDYGLVEFALFPSLAFPVDDFLLEFK